MKTHDETLIQTASHIVEQAKSLQKQLPAHLKLMPEIKQTLSLIHQISEVLLCLAQNQTGGKTDGHHD